MGVTIVWLLCGLIGIPIPEIGDIGFLTYDSVAAGVDTYYDRETQKIVKYNFTNLVFNKFVKEVDNSKKDIII